MPSFGNGGAQKVSKPIKEHIPTNQVRFRIRKILNMRMSQMSTHVSNGNVTVMTIRYVKVAIPDSPAICPGWSPSLSGVVTDKSGVVTVTCLGWSLGGQVVMFKQ